MKIPDRQDRQVFIFVLWEAARSNEVEIIDDIRSHFRILKQFEMIWPPETWTTHLEAFYAHKNSIWPQKARRNGTGNFRVVVVEDPNPEFEIRKNLRGISEMVDINIHNAKARYRKLLKGKDIIHSSVNLAETRQNLAILLGTSLEQFLASLKEEENIEYCFTIPQRERGWENLTELFGILNESMKYVVLRNWEELLHESGQITGDIDFLVESRDMFASLTGAIPISSKPAHSAYILRIKGQAIRCDCREPDDGYYDPAWARKILDTGMISNGIRIPETEQHYFSLLYHALIHKQELPSKYMPFLTDGIKTQADGTFQFQSQEHAIIGLSEWMKHSGFAYCEPKSKKVLFNKENIPENTKTIRTPRGISHLLKIELRFKHFKLHIFSGINMGNIFRMQFRLKGLFKADICIGDLKEIGL